jgi:hypothetical protein
MSTAVDPTSAHDDLGDLLKPSSKSESVRGDCAGVCKDSNAHSLRGGGVN